MSATNTMAPTNSSELDEERVRQINSLRFSWHENVLADAELRKFPTALAFAGHVMHRFDPRRDCAEISFGSAERALKMPRTSVIRARDKLIDRGWIRLIAKPPTHTRRWAGSRYTLTGGPEDLVIEQHNGGYTNETGQ